MLQGLKGSCLFLCMSCCAFAQTAAPLAFEAASIKPNTSGSGSSSTNGSKGQVVSTNVSLKRLIMRAYAAKEFQITIPDWTGDVKFDIAAKYPPDTANDQRNGMLQTLLVERFGLKIHHESKEMSAYALIVAKSGPKLEEGKPGGTSSNSNNSHLEDKGISMSQFADQLANYVDHPVVDKTGLPGVFNLKLDWAPDIQPGAKNDGGSGDALLGPTILAALQDQLGLKLQTQKLPVDILVVDHVERAPTEN
jgi:uncharacterized protein (TIGR03435 family)